MDCYALHFPDRILIRCMEMRTTTIVSRQGLLHGGTGICNTSRACHAWSYFTNKQCRTTVQTHNSAAYNDILDREPHTNFAAACLWYAPTSFLICLPKCVSTSGAGSIDNQRGGPSVARRLTDIPWTSTTQTVRAKRSSFPRRRTQARIASPLR